MKHEVWIKNQLVASVEREEVCLGYKVYSSCLVCPVCMRIWATLTAGNNPVHCPQMVSCETCLWSDELHPVPGSLITNSNISQTGVDWGLLEALPPDLLRREYLLTLRAFNL